MHPNIVIEISRDNKGRHHYPDYGSWMCPFSKKEALQTSQLQLVTQTLPQLRHSRKSQASGSCTGVFLWHCHLPFAYLVLLLNQFVSNGTAMSFIPHNSESCFGSHHFSFIKTPSVFVTVWSLRAASWGKTKEMRRRHKNILALFSEVPVNSGPLPLEHPSAHLISTAVHTTRPYSMVYMAPYLKSECRIFPNSSSLLKSVFFTAVQRKLARNWLADLTQNVV